MTHRLHWSKVRLTKCTPNIDPNCDRSGTTPATASHTVCFGSAKNWHIFGNLCISFFVFQIVFCITCKTNETTLNRKTDLLPQAWCRWDRQSWLCRPSHWVSWPLGPWSSLLAACPSHPPGSLTPPSHCRSSPHMSGLDSEWVCTGGWARHPGDRG